MWYWQAFSIVTALAAAFTPIVSSEVVASMNGVSSYIRAEMPHNIANNPFAAVVWFWPPTSNPASSGTSRVTIQRKGGEGGKGLRLYTSILVYFKGIGSNLVFTIMASQFFFSVALPLVYSFVVHI